MTILKYYDGTDGTWKPFVNNASDAVTLSGDQTIAGKKTFTEDMDVNGDIYSSGSKVVTEATNQSISISTDANGWRVVDFGLFKEYIRNISFATGSIPAQGVSSSGNFKPPVGITSLSGLDVVYSLRTTGYDANRFSHALQQRSLPGNLFIEFFNTWTGGSLTLSGNATIKIRKYN